MLKKLSKTLFIGALIAPIAFASCNDQSENLSPETNGDNRETTQHTGGLGGGSSPEM